MYKNLESGYSRCTRFGEFNYCCCLSHLPLLGCSIHTIWCIDFGLYLHLMELHDSNHQASRVQQSRGLGAEANSVSSFPFLGSVFQTSPSSSAPWREERSAGKKALCRLPRLSEERTKSLKRSLEGIYRPAYDLQSHLQASAKRRSPSLVYFVTSLIYHFCPSLPAAFTQPGAHIL